MRRISCALACCLVIGLANCSKAEDDKKKEPTNKEKIVGTWELVQTAGAMPVGSTIEFTKDGKVKVLQKRKGAEPEEASYVVEGDMIQFLTSEGKPADKRKIIKLSDKELVLDGVIKNDVLKKK